MTDELRDLYQTVVLDHGRQPRNFRRPDTWTHKLEGYNPLCGDEVVLYLQVADGVIVDASFQGSGCAISMASASLMTERIKTLRVEDALTLFDQFHGMLLHAGQGADEQLGKLMALAGVAAFPMRIKCATMVWHTLKAALDGEQNSICVK